MSYYSDNAENYISSTINCDMKAQYDMFLKYFTGRTILDVGFGSARDMLYFKSLGFDVFGIDPEEKFCRNAEEKGLETECTTIEKFETVRKFDGIWACASLLHCRDINGAVSKLKELLNPGGIMYISLKLGDGEKTENGRYFHYVSEDDIISVCQNYKLEVLSTEITNDTLNRELQWINICVK